MTNTRPYFGVQFIGADMEPTRQAVALATVDPVGFLAEVTSRSHRPRTLNKLVALIAQVAAGQTIAASAPEPVTPPVLTVVKPEPNKGKGKRGGKRTLPSFHDGRALSVVATEWSRLAYKDGLEGATYTDARDFIIAAQDMGSKPTYSDYVATFGA